MTEAELLSLASQGDETAFEALYERHCDPIYGFAWALTKSEADAEEVVQDCFMTAIRRAESFEARRSSLRAWLLGIARNLCRRRPRAWSQPDGSEPGETAANDPGIETALIRDETDDAVRRAVLALPEAQREAIVLFEFEEMSLAETAAVLGIEPNAVKARLHRGRAQLKNLLQPLRGQGEARQ